MRASSKTSSLQVATTRSTRRAIRRAIARALVAPLDAAQRVEGVRHRDPQRLGGVEGREPRHPEVRVHDVGALVHPARLQVVREGVHVRQQLVLGQLAGGPRVDVVDRHARRELDAPRQRRVVAPGVHDDLGAAARERLGQLGHVHVLPSRIHPAEHGQRTGVLGHHRDPHPATSSSTASQSARNRPSP
jgi:hypothetical protein